MSNPQNLTSQKDHFFQFLSEIKKYTPSNTSSESFFLDNLRFNFPFTVLPNFEEIENIFSLVNDSRPFAFKTKWLNEEIILLVWSVYQLTRIRGISAEKLVNYLNLIFYNSLKPSENWEMVAVLFQDRTFKQCMFKFFNLLRSNPIKKDNKWTREEDSILFDIASQFQEKKLNFKWNKMAHELYEQTNKNKIRMGKHCRERWNNHLNPNLNKGRWSLQEDNILLKNIAQKGRKWARISRLLQGRNEYAVKNHFYLLMKKYKINPNSQNFCLEIKSLLQSLINSPQSSSSFSKISKHIKKPSFSSNFNCSNALKKLEFNTIAKAKEEPKNQKNNTQIKRENIQETIKIEETKMENQTTEYRSNLKIETNEIKKRESLMMMDFCKSVQENVRLNSWFGMDNPYNPYQMNIITLRQQQMQYLLCKFLEGQPNKLKFNQ